MLALLLLGFALTACGTRTAVIGHPKAPDTCTPPAGGRCAADVAWSGPIELAAHGNRLQGIVLCGGTLRANETDARVTITLHVPALRGGAATCARVLVRVSLATPLGTRAVVDGVSGRTVRVVHGPHG
ncbi:MAG: hypothetical protein WAV00_09435 [Nocardioides sp.]